MTWPMIRRLAETEDRRIRERHVFSPDEDKPRVWVSWQDRDQSLSEQSSSRVDSSPGRSDGQVNIPTSKTYYNSTKSPPRYKERSPPPKGWTRQPIVCNWCGRPGHMERSCWVKHGDCAVCGSKDHSREQCPRSSPSAEFTPTCSNCGGAHFGKDCDQQN